MKSLRAIVFGITGASMLAAQGVPQDAAPNCQADQKTFNKWFKSGTPSLNGFVNPADSVGFAESTERHFRAGAGAGPRSLAINSGPQPRRPNRDQERVV